MAAFGVHSEVGKLRQVIVHRPDLSLSRLTPANHDELLFDDVLWVERAQWEHDQFVARMRERGVEVHYVQDLLSEALAASQDARQRLTDLVSSEYVVGVGLVEPVREALGKLAPDALARHLIGGLTVGAVHPRFIVLDLRRRLDQSDVLAGAPPRSLQHGRDLQGPPDVRGPGFRVLVPAAR